MKPSSASPSAPSLNRREFVAGAAALGAMFAVGANGQTATTSSTMSKLQDTFLVHHVFFWLKNPDSKEDLNALLDGIRALAEIPGVKGLHVGVPADTEKREVVENSYSASEILLFDSLEAQATYQSHPLHQKFIDENEHRWAKVMVFDSVKA
ncbi:Dabb family protein [Actomonas aquatica]|uniref:Dabb family protein n=1 Tax=Actomonas aquatica TaxID=2866162 RepID=A0ABZ1CBU8_9BACT|nr:Dabb family protein [Opitutus sp. WL0086]WRQ88865.1 Dabb family protein [Opitutus sp. WL0086]